MKNEIGSEFWRKDIEYFKGDDTFFLCGRTALDAIIKDAIKNHGIKRALLPSYCCHTMIEPFIRNNIKVRFYDVYIGNNGLLTANIPDAEDNEILYIMKYFGDVYLDGTEFVNTDSWNCTLEDLTHSCFCSQYNSNAEYTFESYRKWFAVDGVAIARKAKGSIDKPSGSVNQQFLYLRHAAFNLKNKYMHGEKIEKKEYLNLFSEAEGYLEKNYANFSADINSIICLADFLQQSSEMRKRRKRNADILYHGIKYLKNNLLTVTDFSKPGECPLFFPIIVLNGERDVLKQYLIEHNVYCPVHWPITEYHKDLTQKAKELYEKEISLVCDQRYDDDDMYRIVHLIQKYYKI